jgi:hypothetical protein
MLAVAVAGCVLTGCTSTTTNSGEAAGTPTAPASSAASPAPVPGTATSAPAQAAASAPALAPASAGPGSGTKNGPDSFVGVVRAKLPEVAVDRRDEEIQAIADSACSGLIAGKTADDVIAAARTLGTVDAEATDHATARELVKLAIDTTCFGERDRVDEF